MPLVLLLVVLGWVGPAWAARTLPVDGPLLINLEPAQPTAIIYPEEVSTITLGIPETRLQVSKEGPMMGLVLLDPQLPESRLLVTGISGRLYLTKVRAVPGRGDDIVYIAHKPASKAQALTADSAIRLLRQSQTTPAALAQAEAADFPPPQPSDTRVQLIHPRPLTLGRFSLLLATLENTLDVPVQLDIRVGTSLPPERLGIETVALTSWIWPPRRALVRVAVEQDILPAHGSTILYAVFEERR
jgi:hypothetical protein